MKTNNKILSRRKRRWAIRKKVIGRPDRPRVCFSRSLKHMYIQLIDDLDGKTIITCGTVSKDFKERFPDSKNNKQAASVLGELVAERALKKGIKKVVFDRSGYKFHGRVKAFAESARKKGLEF